MARRVPLSPVAGTADVPAPHCRFCLPLAFPAAVVTGLIASASLAQQKASEMSAQQMQSIGVARMRPDGTIEMDLRATGPGGAKGDARVTYAPDNPHYREIQQHLGWLRPGQEKLVPPF